MQLLQQNAFTQSMTSPLIESLPKVTSVDFTQYVEPRAWLFERTYIRGFVSGTAATGGTGKTSIMDVETVSMALGRNLFTGEPLRAGPLKVLILSLEDDSKEYHRRLKSIALHYGLTPEEIQKVQVNMYQIFDSNGSIKIVHKHENTVEANHRVIDWLGKEIKSQKVDVMTIDPLVSFHEANENDNGEMQTVLAALRGLAREYDISIHFLHHNRKGGDSNADSMRGAVSLRDGARVLRMLSKFNPKDAQEIGIPAKDAKHIIVSTTGKSNATTGGDGQFYKMVGVKLDNETEKYQADFVGVATTYQPPSLFDGFSMDQIKQVWKTIGESAEELRRENPQAGNWIGHIVAKLLDMDSKQDRPRIKRMLNAWQQSEGTQEPALVSYSKPNPKDKNKSIPYLKLNPAFKAD
jgi:RecA-family ATPase